jgi:acetolactate synthase-1/2/3 large subunit
MIKVSDYISNFFNKNGIDSIFTITGGFSMHLNDSFGKNDLYNITYNHHEQACGYSAIGYSKTNNKPCIVCTTAGCAATNAITPCLVAFQDSLPILFISGQVKSMESIRTLNTKNKKLRHYAGADCDIISMVESITKYSKEISDVSELKETLIEAYKNLISGRPGPVWISIPIDIQGMLINDSDIDVIQNIITNEKIDTDNFDKIHYLLKNSTRPLIIAGNGIKLANSKDKFNNFINKYNIPVVVTFHGTDIIETEHHLYAGKIGLIGNRHGNFTLQNCDLLISLGCRMSQAIIGYRSDWFARDAKIIYIDNDLNELEKDNLNYELKINMDLNSFFDNYNYNTINYSNWIEKCIHWKNKWINEMPDINDNNGINPYFFLNTFFNNAPENKITIVSSGSIITNVWHMINIKKNDKFLISSQGDMGFELPSAIGAQLAEPDKIIIPILGEGSFQLNIQELQTIVHNKLPIKILLFNNNSYGSIVITQNNFFKNQFGVNSDCGLSFPNTEKIANSYGIKYLSVTKNENIISNIEEFLSYNETIILEVFCCIQSRYPRLQAMKNNDGTFTNRPFEDMEPFMDRDEFKKEMIIKII